MTPPADAYRILAESEGLKIIYILITHGHSDHIGALERVNGSTGALVGIHPLDSHRLQPLSEAETSFPPSSPRACTGQKPKDTPVASPSP